MTKELKPLKSILFVSRNKDNKHLPDFKERRYVRLTTKTAEELKKILTIGLQKDLKVNFVVSI